jgi:hypothetical protein
MCGFDKPSPTPDECGHLFFTLKATSEHDPGGILRNPSTTHHYSGLTIPWFICDECARKGHDWSGVTGLCISIFCGIAVFVFRAEGLILFAGIGFLISLYACIYWLKGTSYRSKYCRDRILQKSVDKLVCRDDFLALYGSLGIKGGHTLTRFSRGAI